MKTKNVISAFLLLTICSFLLLQSACKKENEEEPEPPPTNDTELIVNENVAIIDETSLNLVSTSEELNQGIYKYQYSGTAPNYNTSTVIVGQEGYGYMRKVTSISQSGNEITLQTSQAKLTDVIDQFYINESSKLTLSKKKSLKVDDSFAEMKIIYLAEGVSFNETKDTKGSISLSGTELFSGTVGSANLTAKITSGSISFEPTFKREIKIGLTSPHIKKLLLSAEGSIDFDCDLQLVCSGPVNYNKEIPIAIMEYGPFMIGPVPMFVGFSFYAGFETQLNLTGTFQTGYLANASVEFGAQYNNSQWSTIWNKSSDFTKHSTTWNYDGDVFARAYISPQVSVKIAAVAGPYLEVEPYLEFEGDIQSNTWQYDLAGGLDGNLGFVVGVFGYNLADYSTNLLNYETVFFSDNGNISVNDPPVSNFSANTISITEGESVSFTDLSTNNPTSWSWNFGDGGTSTSQNPSHTYSTSGNYTVSLTSTNAYGSDTETKNNYISVNTSYGSWIQKANFGSTSRAGTVGFTIGDKGYIGTGNNTGSDTYSDFWEYDPVSNTWTQKADFGGGVRTQAVGFSIGTKGYVGTGTYNFNSKNDFWEYNPSTNNWTQKTNFGGTARKDAIGFSIGSKGYIGTGYDGSNKSDFWEYNPSTDTWSQKAEFSGTARQDAVGFSIGSKGYLGTGAGSSGYKNDFWEYNPSSNSWTQKANFVGVARESAVGFSINDFGYIGLGSTGSFSGNEKKDFWKYDPSTNSWTQKANFGGTARGGAACFSINGKGYIGTGGIYGPSFYQDFWVYTP